MIRIIQTDANDFSDMRYRNAIARLAAHQRQTLGLDFGELRQRFLRQRVGSDVIKDAREITELALKIDQSGFFMAGAAVTYQLHVFPFC